MRHAVLVWIGIILNLGFVIPLLFCPRMDPRPVPHTGEPTHLAALRGAAAGYPVGLLHSGDARHRPLSGLRLAGGVPVAHLRQRVLLSRGLRVRSAARLPGGRAARRVDRHRNALVPDPHRASRAGDRRGEANLKRRFWKILLGRARHAGRGGAGGVSSCCCVRWHSRRPTTSPRSSTMARSAMRRRRDCPSGYGASCRRSSPNISRATGTAMALSVSSGRAGEPVPVGILGQDARRHRSRGAELRVLPSGQLSAASRTIRPDW